MRRSYQQYIDPYTPAFAEVSRIREGAQEQSLRRPDRAAAGGLPLLREGESLWVDAGEAHSLILGTTGTGKSQKFVLPTVLSLLHAGESLLVTCPKGEPYQRTAAAARALGYRVLVLDLRNYRVGERFNPLAQAHRLYNNGQRDRAVQLLNSLVYYLSAEQAANCKDAYWPETARGLMLGMALILMSGPARSCNLSRLYQMCSMNSAKSWLRDLKPVEQRDALAADLLRSMPTDAERTLSCVCSTACSMLLGFVQQDAMREMMSDSSFELEEIARRKTVIYLMLSDQDASSNALAQYIVESVYMTLTALAEENGGRLERRFDLVLEETCNMPRLQKLPTMAAMSRGRNLRLFLVGQNLALFRSVYGDDAEAILAECGNRVFLGSQDLHTLRTISALCGEMEVDGALHPVVPVGQLAALPQGQALVWRQYSRPYLARLPWLNEYPDSFTMADCPVPEPAPLKPERSTVNRKAG